MRNNHGGDVVPSAIVIGSSHKPFGKFVDLAVGCGFEYVIGAYKIGKTVGTD